MRRLALILGLLVAMTAVPAYASHSMVGGSQECGTYTANLADDLTKGRTDGVLVTVNHTEGCFTFKFRNVIGADREEMASNPGKERGWQNGKCEKDGIQQTVGHFEFYRDMKIDPSSVKVSCAPWTGGD